MRIDPATPIGVKRVALSMRDRDLAEFLALSRAGSREELAEELALAYGGKSGVTCVRADDDTPIAIGGAVILRPNVASVLFFATPRFREVTYELTRYILRVLFPELFASGVHRIEALAMADYVGMHRWLFALGFVRECGMLQAYGKDKEDFYMFSIVKPDNAENELK